MKRVMKLLLPMIVVGLICSCLAATQVGPKPAFTKEAVEACDEFCGGSGMLLYRDKTTHFCECSGKRTVVGRLGTIYK